MPDDCDPAVLHARVCVLEANDKRHETDLSQLFGKVSALEVYTSSLPKIERSLDEIRSKVEALTASTVRNDGASVAYLTVREWMIVAIALAGVLLDHFVIH